MTFPEPSGLSGHRFIRVMADAVQQRARELADFSEWIPGTVVTFDRLNRLATVILDEDTVIGSPTAQAAVLVPGVGPQQRVMCQKVQPFGLAITGEITDQPWEVFTPRLNGATGGPNAGPNLGTTAKAEARFLQRGTVTQAHVYFFFGGTGVTAGPETWALTLPVSRSTAMHNSGESDRNFAIGHGWILTPANGLRTAIVDSPIGNGDIRYATIRRDFAGLGAIGGPGDGMTWAANSKVVLHLSYMTD